MASPFFLYPDYDPLGAYLDYPDAFAYDNGPVNEATAPYPGDAAQGSDEAEGPPYNPEYPEPQTSRLPSEVAPMAPPAQPLPEEDPVTIVFKDGRPPEQIHNYALTRTMLYLPGRHPREIPLELVDLPATEKLNRDAGVEFRLPQAP